jgi:hypothetical protein
MIQEVQDERSKLPMDAAMRNAQEKESIVLYRLKEIFAGLDAWLNGEKNHA